MYYVCTPSARLLGRVCTVVPSAHVTLVVRLVVVVVVINLQRGAGSLSEASAQHGANVLA